MNPQLGVMVALSTKIGEGFPVRTKLEPLTRYLDIYIKTSKYGQD